MPQSFIGSCQDALELRPRRRILCKLPRLLVRYKLVHSGDPRPRRLERPRKVQRVEFFIELSFRIIYSESDIGELFPDLTPGARRNSLEIVLDHRQRAARQIPQSICKV